MPAILNKVAVKGMVYAQIKRTRAGCSVPDFNLPVKNVRQALSVLCTDVAIHKSHKKPSPTGKGGLWVYKLGPAPGYVPDGVDIPGIRDAFPNMFRVPSKGEIYSVY